MKRKLKVIDDPFVHQQMMNFRKFLVASWKTFLPFNKVDRRSWDDEHLFNWFQGNWELLVENAICEICEFLATYGYGADFGGESSRVSFSEKLPTHKIICIPQKPELVDKMHGGRIDFSDTEFFMFVSWKNGYYDIAPPFDHVVLMNSKGHFSYLRLKDVKFGIRPAVK